MSSPLAWPRVFAFLIFILTLIPYAYSQEESIFTSSVTYCNPPETLLIQRFELAYFPGNRSVSFNVSAASVQANVNVSANVFLNVYGMKPVNITLDLCGLLGGALCPLPMYNFTGADSITLPSSLEVLQKIPGIAYKIPDLEGFAQLTLTEPKTGNVRACVQATLSNGRSAHQPAVEWTTGGVTLAALSVALWQTIVSPQSIIPFRLLELMYLFQTISSSAFLSLNYPSVYRAYALNFAWAMGLLTSGPNSGFQNSINNMRRLTGGNLADEIEGSAVGFVNRKLSPYNQPLSSREIINAYSNLSSNFTVDLSSLSSSEHRSNAFETIVNGVVQTVTSATSNVLQAGIPIYVNTKHIATANAFMTVFLVSLIMFVIAFGVFAIGYGIRFLLERKQVNSRVASIFMNFDYISFAVSWFLRLGLVAVFPLFIFIFYQWTLKDSWLSIFLSVLTLIAISALILYPSFLTLRLARQESPVALYTPGTQSLSRNGPLFAQYRSPRYYFFVPLLIAFVLRAIFISFAKSSAEAQIALLLVVEFGLVCAHFALKPAKTRGGDVFNTYLSITRFVCTGLMIAFLEKLQVKAIPRVVIGIVVALAWSVAVLIVIGNITWHTVLAFAQLLGLKKRTQPSILDSPVNSEGSMLEKGIRGTQSGSTRSNLNEKNLRVAATSNGVGGDNDSGVSLPYVVADGEDIEEIARGRPMNPTPENNGAFEPYLLTSFPISPTTTVTTMEPPSLYSRDSGTITVGSLLPRRWSFHMSQPGSPAGSSFGHGYPSTQMSPSPIPPSSPSESSHGGAVSRNTSVRAQQQSHQQRHSDIEEEEEGLPTSPTVKPT
ncbi:TRP-like ion channel pkd2 [Psilocybe cubensis]|uniref:TRP-like ion channel pkd2 n=2 Tax=Psilocybe cubensis TaxID=181762 RepID=A0ACB8HAH1_PSICU|nr:TRP-like ion channel pkd2 [Psilocybe cubensis]KAH9484998.1 TRP-like ion channel pkd2 [Psilocybe cubensis]